MGYDVYLQAHRIIVKTIDRIYYESLYFLWIWKPESNYDIQWEIELVTVPPPPLLRFMQLTCTYGSMKFYPRFYKVISLLLVESLILGLVQSHLIKHHRFINHFIV